MAQFQQDAARQPDRAPVGPPTSSTGRAPVEIEARDVGGVTVLALKGRLQVGADMQPMRDRINALIQRGCRRLLLNLQDVSAIDSDGLGVIIGTYSRLRSQGGQLKLLKTPKRIRELMVLTELATVIESFDEEADALRGFLRS